MTALCRAWRRLPARRQQLTIELAIMLTGGVIVVVTKAAV